MGELSLTQPVSVWNRPLETDFRKLFVALGKTAAQGAAQNWGKAGAAAVEALGAVGLEKDPAQLAWLLIVRSITRALYSLVGEQEGRLFPGEHDIDVVAKSIDLSLEETEVTIDSTFFTNPRQLPLLDDLRTPFRDWLVGAGLDPARATSVADRLPQYFVFALTEEWVARKESYEVIHDRFTTPFQGAVERDLAWRQYSARLQMALDEPIFDEGFGLRQLYVPLRAYWKERAKRKDRFKRHDDDAKAKLHVVDLETALVTWIDKADRRDAIRVLSGGPGSGKSSFAKLFAARQATRNRFRVILVPLHHLIPGDDFADSLSKFARNVPELPEQPLDPRAEGDRTLVILDGLDELSKQGKVGEGIAKAFVRQVQDAIALLNLNRLKLQVLISGRILAMQWIEEDVELDQILNLIGYFVPEQTRSNFEDPEKHLQEDQRDRWWQRYGELTGRDYDGLPKELATPQLLEINSQPLLNYLLALSVVRGKLNFSQNPSLNELFDDLLSEVYSRKYEAGRYKPTERISREEFVRILEEIALAAWHGDGRTTTVKAIAAQCEAAKLTPALDIFKEGAKDGVTRLLTAFYFRRTQGDTSHSDTFEFTHKSFGEYLTALRIARLVEMIQEQRAKEEKNTGCGWDVRQALVVWAQVCGPTAMDGDLLRFLVAECCLRGEEVARVWRSQIVELIDSVLLHGSPMELLSPRLGYREEKRQARNAEEALLALHSACTRVTDEASSIRWPSYTAAGIWLRELNAQTDYTHKLLALTLLKKIDFSSQLLLSIDFENAHLQGANLQGAYLRRAYLQGAHLQGANLQGAYLWDASLQDAYLQGANLREADLRGANLRGAYLQGANLQRADLRRVDLHTATLWGAHLQTANLQTASLWGADLRGADLRGADLRGADLQRAHLQRANLQDLRGEPAQKPEKWDAYLRESAELYGEKKPEDDL